METVFDHNITREEFCGMFESPAWASFKEQGIEKEMIN